jgi:hypothetical protein
VRKLFFTLPNTGVFYRKLNEPQNHSILPGFFKPPGFEVADSRVVLSDRSCHWRFLSAATYLNI